MVCTRNMHWRLAVDNDHVLKPAGGGVAAVRPGQGYGRQSHQSRGPTKPHHPEKTAGLLEAQTHGYDQGTARCVDGELDCPESLPQNQSRSIVTSGRSHASTHAGDAASGVSGKFQPGAQGKQEGALQIKSKLKMLMDLWQVQPMREAPAPHSVNGGTHSSDIGLAQLPARHTPGNVATTASLSHLQQLQRLATPPCYLHGEDMAARTGTLPLQQQAVQPSASAPCSSHYPAADWSRQHGYAPPGFPSLTASQAYNHGAASASAFGMSLPPRAPARPTEAEAAAAAAAAQEAALAQSRRAAPPAGAPSPAGAPPPARGAPPPAGEQALAAAPAPVAAPPPVGAPVNQVS